MGEAVMNLTPEQLEAIGTYVRGHLKEWMGSGEEGSLAERELNLRERMVRVEEALKLGFENTAKLIAQIDKRIDQIDKRIDQVDKRFDQVDKRFEDVNLRFSDLIHQMDKRFEQVDKRFTQMFAYFTTGFVILGVIMTLYKFLL